MTNCECGHPPVYHQPTGRCNAVMISAHDEGLTCLCSAFAPAPSAPVGPSMGPCDIPTPNPCLKCGRHTKHPGARCSDATFCDGRSASAVSAPVGPSVEQASEWEDDKYAFPIADKDALAAVWKMMDEHHGGRSAPVADIIVTYASALRIAARPAVAPPRTNGHQRAMGVVETRVEGSMDWPEDFSHENGNYLCQCVNCGCIFVGHKRRVTCRVCSVPTVAPPSAIVELFNDQIAARDRQIAELQAGVTTSWSTSTGVAPTRASVEAAILRVRELWQSSLDGWESEKVEPSPTHGPPELRLAYLEGRWKGLGDALVHLYALLGPAGVPANEPAQSALNAAVTAYHAAKPSEDQVVVMRDELVEVLQDAWNDYCTDAGARPEGFEIRGKVLTVDFSLGGMFIENAARALAWKANERRAALSGGVPANERASETTENIARNYVPERESLPCGDEVEVLTFRDRVALVEAGRAMRDDFDTDVLRCLCGEAAQCTAEVDNDAARELTVRLNQAWSGEDPVGVPANGAGETTRD